MEALTAVKLNLRTIHEAKTPVTTIQLFGKELSMPILGAPMTGTAINMGGALTEQEWIQAVVTGCKNAGTIGMTGDTADPACFEAGAVAIENEQGLGITFIKPRTSQEEIINRIRRAEEVGALAVGIDIDGAGLITMALRGQPVGPKSKAELKELIESTKLPFILKGIMTVDEAEIAAEIGAAAIVVSNHGGRVLDDTPGAADVLAEIAETVRGQLTVFADGGVRTGVDVLKYIALGADAVLVGRPLMHGAFGNGAEGVKLLMETMANELKQAMILTGSASVAEIDERVIYW
jgi:isopentenyl diphosphate isomerase/L-lactate dehydrogenase-like FMN-dependent dehydrogenase